MRRQQAFTLLFAVCCLLALANMSASLGSTVSTTPDDVVDFDYGSVPLPAEEASQLKRSFQSGASDADSGEAARASKSARSDQRQPSGGSDADGERRSGSRDEAGTGPSERDPGLLARLLALLEALLGLLPAVAALGAVALTVHQRARLLAWIRDRLDRFRSTDGAAEADPSPAVHSPDNRVERAWLELLSEADVDPEPSATPRECAERLVEVGFDRDSVWELTTLFERVRYDGVAVTPDRAERATACLDRVARRGGDS